MYNKTIQPAEANAQYLGWVPSLLGAEFVRGRVCQGQDVPESYTVIHYVKYYKELSNIT